MAVYCQLFIGWSSVDCWIFLLTVSDPHECYDYSYDEFGLEGDARGYLNVGETHVDYGVPRVRSCLDINHVLKSNPKQINKWITGSSYSFNYFVHSTTVWAFKLFCFDTPQYIHHLYLSSVLIVSGVGRVSKPYGLELSKYLPNAGKNHVDPNGDIEPMREAILAVRDRESLFDSNPLREHVYVIWLIY